MSQADIIVIILNYSNVHGDIFTLTEMQFHDCSNWLANTLYVILCLLEVLVTEKDPEESYIA